MEEIDFNADGECVLVPLYEIDEPGDTFKENDVDIVMAAELLRRSAVFVGDNVSVNGGRGTGRSSSNGLDHRGTNHTDTPSNTIPPKKFPPPSVVF